MSLSTKSVPGLGDSHRSNSTRSLNILDISAIPHHSSVIVIPNTPELDTVFYTNDETSLGDESAMRKKSSELKKKQNQKLPNNLKIIREQDELIRNLNAQLEKGRARFAEEMKQLRDDHAKKLKQMNEELVNMKKTFGCSAKESIGFNHSPDSKNTAKLFVRSTGPPTKSSDGNKMVSAQDLLTKDRHRNTLMISPPPSQSTVDPKFSDLLQKLLSGVHNLNIAATSASKYTKDLVNNAQSKISVAKAGDFVKMMNDLEQMEHESVEATLSKTTELMKTCSGTVFDMKQDIEELNKRNQS